MCCIKVINNNHKDNNNSKALLYKYQRYYRLAAALCSVETFQVCNSEYTSQRR